jgi:pyrroloquinoline-quinone synthase
MAARLGPGFDENAGAPKFSLSLKIQLQISFRRSQMNLSNRIEQNIEPVRLLDHPFYQAWVAGELSRDDLQHYAKAYFAHVLAFPRYVSGVHSQCEDLESRRQLLDNLIDEEAGEDHHPELWLRFAEGLGQERGAVVDHEDPATAELVGKFLSRTRSSYAEGLGALFAYESQIPEVATTKIDSLKNTYDVTDERTLSFFSVHAEADVYHTQAISEQLDNLSEAESVQAEEAASECAQGLWDFLSVLDSRRH